MVLIRRTTRSGKGFSLFIVSALLTAIVKFAECVIAQRYWYLITNEIILYVVVKASDDVEQICYGYRLLAVFNSGTFNIIQDVGKAFSNLWWVATHNHSTS